MKHDFGWKSKNDLQNWWYTKHSAPWAVFVSIIILKTYSVNQTYSGMFRCEISINSAAVLKWLSPCWDETHFELPVQRGDYGRTGWSSRGFVEARCSVTHIKVIWPSAHALHRRPPTALTATPEMSQVRSAGCCVVLLGRAGKSVAKKPTSAVQRTFLDCFGHRGAQESNDGAGVIASYHGAARHNHVGPCLKQTWAHTYCKRHSQNLIFRWLFY